MGQGYHRQAPEIITASDTALLVRFGGRPGPTMTRRVLALLAALDADPPRGLTDLVPAYASLLVRFDPLVMLPEGMTAILRLALAQTRDAPMPRGRLIRVPVVYGGDDGPDLDEVARLLGLTPVEVIRRHSAATYQVAFLGFLAGFPYLTGLSAPLAVPRLATPRTRVPAGSVAIAERQAGIYPVETPGGWRILGRTSLPLFDPTQDPPALLRPGDRIRFYQVDETPPPAALTISDAASISNISLPAAHDAMETPWLRVIRSGMFTTIQDCGRPGYARYGIATAGAADGDALAISNALLANSPNAAALEITGGDAEFQALAPSIVAVTGAPCVVRVDGRVQPMGMTLELETGATLTIEPITIGMRVYLGVAGGIFVPRVLGSWSTETRTRLGGLEGRALHAGDLLHRGCGSQKYAGRVVPPSLLTRLPVDRHWLLRVLPRRDSGLTLRELAPLIQNTFVVDARSDRVGVRLRRVDGPCLAGGQMLSEGVPRGAVQVPPDGEPVLLLADAQATGGYRVPLVVIGADLWRLGQLRPDDTVRFRYTGVEEALAALRQCADEIESVRLGPTPLGLSNGFCEWSDEDN